MCISLSIRSILFGQFRQIQWLEEDSSLNSTPCNIHIKWHSICKCNSYVFTHHGKSKFYFGKKSYSSPSKAEKPIWASITDLSLPFLDWRHIPTAEPMYKLELGQEGHLNRVPFVLNKNQLCHFIQLLGQGVVWLQVIFGGCHYMMPGHLYLCSSSYVYPHVVCLWLS